MPLRDALLPEFDQEVASTRRCLEQVSEDQFDWQPHAKSMSLAGLTTHLCNLPRWAVMTLQQDEFDLAPGGEMIREQPVTSLAQALSRFDELAADSAGAHFLGFRRSPNQIDHLRHVLERVLDPSWTE